MPETLSKTRPASPLDVFDTLRPLDVGALDPLQRIFLVTDGTLTELLEAAFLERIELVKLARQESVIAALPALLEATPDETLLHRKILLRGATSGRHYVYAESVIALDRLDPVFSHELLTSNTPLGQLMLAHRLETFKQLCDVRREKAGGLASYFACAESASLLARTYRVFCGARPVIGIGEYFPMKY